MRRRDFIVQSGIAAAALATPGALQARGKQSRQFIELRIYHFASPDKQHSFAHFVETAAIPAFNRAGARPVGVFKLQMSDNPDLKLTADSTDLYVLLPHHSADSLATFLSQLGGDQVFQQAGKEIITAPKSDPAFQRYESSLMLAFEDFPQVKVPTSATTRLLQLRIYESHSNERARKKIEMFNQGGELAIFARSGMTGVFFGQTLIGSKLPNLTYMLAFPTEQDQKKAWDTFRNDSEWKRLSAAAEYKDTVSNVTNLILRPAAGSQI
ncbi:MAG TPA: NIPSNAP family protein [Terriglobales bacterium]|nr:NIPSNAP family protein [Terriglobales bacterium]